MMTVMMPAEDKVALCKSLNEFAEFRLPSYVNLSLQTYSVHPSALWNEEGYKYRIMLSVWVIIIIGGLLGNITVILLVALKRAMRTIINFYIVNLAVADAGMCIFGTAEFSFRVMPKGVLFILGEFTCKFAFFMHSMCTLNSLMTLAAISVTRFMGVMFPLRVRATQQRPCVVIAILWILSIVLSIPIYFISYFVLVEWKNFLQTTCTLDISFEWYYDESLGECVARVTQTLALLYGGCYFSISILSLFMIIIGYAIILWKVRTLETPGEQLESNANEDSRTRKRVNMMIFVVLLVFFICLAPLQVVQIYFILGLKLTKRSTGLETLYNSVLLFTMLSYAHTFISPILFGTLKKDFREEFSSILRCVYLRNRWRKSGITPNRPRNAFEARTEPEPRGIHEEMELRNPVVIGDSSPAL